MPGCRSGSIPLGPQSIVESSGKLHMLIKHIDTVLLNLSYIDDLAVHIVRSGLASSRAQVTLYRVELEDGTVGFGELMGKPTDVSAFVGRNAVAALKDISHGGVQMACYDAVGRALDLPAHSLMGRQARKQVPFAYWSIDIPPETLASQAQMAVAKGYRVYKFKCRPWWDPVEQMEKVASTVPEGISFWLDFNGHLRDVRQAIPVLKALSEFDCVGGFESPIPQRDAEGYRLLRNKIDRPIAAHYGSGCCHVQSDPNFDKGVSASDQVSRGLCDGFVFGGADVETIRHRASVAEEAKIPFWIQMTGTGLRASWIAHLASTCRQGILAHLAAQNVWDQDVVEDHQLNFGFLKVPDSPGLGVSVDEEAINRLSSAVPSEMGRQIATVVYPDGKKCHFSSEQQRQEAFYFGDFPGFVRGVYLDVTEDDGSKEFQSLYERCFTSPLMDE